MQETIRVVAISHNYYPYIGGAERLQAGVNPVLQERGMEIYALARRTPGTIPFERVNGVPVYRLPASGPKAVAFLSFSLTALRMLRRLRPDIIHAHIMFSPATIAVIAKYFWEIPIVVTVHGGGLPPSGEVARLQQKFFGRRRLDLFRRRIDRFIAVSREIEQELQKIGIPDERRIFLPNGVDLGHFTPPQPEEKQALRQKMSISEGPVAVFTGRLSQEKRVKHLLTVWPAVRREYPEALLLIVGVGPEAKALQQAAGDGVRFIGGVDDVRPYLQVADLLVLPSAAEGLSLSLLEAMASGVPVLATRLAGALDLITHGENGWLVPPDDVPALEHAILTLFREPDVRSKIGSKGCEHVRAHYDLAVTIDRLENLYRQLLTEHREARL